MRRLLQSGDNLQLFLAKSYEALGRIAVPVLSAGKQLDLDWELRRRDGSTFLARMIAKGIAVYAVSEDLAERGLADCAVVKDVRRISRNDVARLMNGYDRVWRW